MLRFGHVAAIGVFLGVTGCAIDPFPPFEEPNAPTGFFEEGPSMLTARFSHASVLLADQNEVLVSGGIISNAPPWLATNSVEGFAPPQDSPDPKSNTWSYSTLIVIPRSRHQTVLLGDGNILVVGGQTNTPMPCPINEPCPADPYLSKSGIFNLTCNPSPMCNWLETSEMAYPRADFVALALQNRSKVLVSGGKATVFPAHAELFDASTKEWTTLPGSQNPIRVSHVGVALPNDDVLLIGGRDEDEKPIAIVDRFSLASNSWTTAGALNLPRSMHTATSLGDGRVLVTGGTQADKENALSSTEIYDDKTNSWTNGPPMHEKRAGHAAILLTGNRRVLVVGGYGEVNGTPGLVESAEILELETMLWTKIELLADQKHLARHWMPTMHVFPQDGRVLVIGGATIATKKIGAEEITTVEPLSNTAIFTPPCTSHFDCAPKYRCGTTHKCFKPQSK